MKKYLLIEDRILDMKVKIQGTDFDRSRKVTNAMKKEMVKMRRRGLSVTNIANKFGVAPNTVRYNIDNKFKQNWNADRNNYARNNSKGFTTLEDRANYKRELIEKGIL